MKPIFQMTSAIVVKSSFCRDSSQCCVSLFCLLLLSTNRFIYILVGQQKEDLQVQRTIGPKADGLINLRLKISFAKFRFPT